MKNFWYYFIGIDALLIALAVAVVSATLRRGRKTPRAAAPTEEELRHWEARAPGWKIRCLKCGLTEPFGKYGIRKWATGKKYTFGYCVQCRALRFYVVEREQKT